MEYEYFIKSLNSKIPPELNDYLLALWLDKKGHWDRAHQIVQDLPTKEGSWIHAYLHRKEGDQWNSEYWYLKARKPVFNGTLDKEWDELVNYFTRIQK